MKKTSKTKPAKPENKPTLVAFLLDRSQSMLACKSETISGFNAYVDQLKKQDLADMRFTLTQFNSMGIDLVHNAVPLAKVDQMTNISYLPRANTPLYDAIGRTVRATQLKAGDKYKVLFVTLTDGEENSSSVFNLESIRALIKEMEDKHNWTFAHIGVGADGWSAARSYSFGTMSASNVMMADAGDEKQTYDRFAGQTMRYAGSIASATCSVQNFWVDPDAAAVQPGKVRKGGKGQFKL